MEVVPTSRERIKTLRNKFPDISATEMAKLLSISRIRVREILQSEGLALKIKNPPTKCHVCGKIIKRQRKYCSVECRSKVSQLVFYCAYCGNPKLIGISQYRTKKKKSTNLFCSLSCRSKGTHAIKKAKDSGTNPMRKLSTGGVFQQTVSPHQTCAVCDEHLLTHWKFCPGCGANITVDRK